MDIRVGGWGFESHLGSFVFFTKVRPKKHGSVQYGMIKYNVNAPLIEPNQPTWQSTVQYGYYWNSASKFYFSGSTTKRKLNSEMVTPVDWTREEIFKLISLWSEDFIYSATTGKVLEEQPDLSQNCWWPWRCRHRATSICLYASNNLRHFLSITALLATKDL